MAFKHLRSFGQHNVLSYDTSKHQFIEFFKDLYKTSELNKLHLTSQDYQKEGLCDVETELHKMFYREIKSNERFKTLYCNLIKDIYQTFFPDEPCLLYQSFPSVRFQFINNISVPPHYDSDDLGRHPIGERNFLLPITEMVRSKRLFIESAPGAKDFQGIDLDYGELLYFNGNKCTHYNETNIEDTIRISMDFRVVTLKDYMNYINSGQITTTNPRDPEKGRVPTKMVVGGYYQITFNGDSAEQMLDWHHQKDLLLQSRPSFNEAEATACYNYMREGDNFVTEFQQTEQLERALSEYIGCRHTIMTTSGNTALIIALMALNIGPGDEVIVPNYTMIASINSIKVLGAQPVIVDVDPNTLTLSVETIEPHINSKTKAVMHVSLNNRQKDIGGLINFCNSRGIEVVEDAAQSLGCRVDGKHFGTFGKIGCFSLSTPKIISTGQGGFLVTDDDEMARKIRMIKNFGRRSGGIDIFETFGLNFKFTDIQAVIGLEQMKKLPDRVLRLREIFDNYYNGLSGIPQIKMHAPQSPEWIPWFVDIFIEDLAPQPMVGVSDSERGLKPCEDRDELMNFLKIHNIQTRATYPEINKTPMYFDDITHINSHYVSQCGLFLPTHIQLTDRQIKHICQLIRMYYSGKNE